MCGILFFNSNTITLRVEQFEAALNLMSHRGPDSSYIWFRDPSNSKKICKYFGEVEQHSNLLIGHNRLAIFDPSSSADQPFVDSTHTKFLAYNGEFYNFKDYAVSPEQKSDGIVLFEQLRSNGPEAFDWVNGMWASIYGDLRNNKIFLSRDRYGKKPLYFFHDTRVFLAASEPKALFYLLSELGLTGSRRKVTTSGVARFFLGKLTPFPMKKYKFYESIDVIPPGQNFVLDISKNSLSHHSNVLWDELYSPEKFVFPAKDCELLELIKEDLADSIRLRLQADAKVAMMLSGGIDSSLIVGNAAQLLTKDRLNIFSAKIFYPNGQPNPDIELARETSMKLGLQLSEVEPSNQSEQSFIDLILEITKYVELPLNPQLSSIPTFLLTKEMANQGFKVCLDGIGGDEVFGGYSTSLHLSLANAHHGSAIASMFHFFDYAKHSKYSNARDFITFLKILRRYIFKRGQHNSMNKEAIEIFNSFNNDDLWASASELEKSFFIRSNLTSKTEQQKFDLSSYQIPYYTGIADNCSMANSVENRSPFLDYRLAKYLYLPHHQKNKNGIPKRMLRAAVPDNIPKRITANSEKYGLGTSFKSRVFKDKNTLELISASSFVRSFVPIDEIREQFRNENFVVQQFLALAALDEVYGLEL